MKPLWSVINETDRVAISLATISSAWTQTIKATLNVKQPMDLQIPLPDLLLQAVAMVLKLGPGVVAERRAVHCNRILKRVKELETEEKVLHEKLHPQVRSVLQGKRLLIWRELVVETGYPVLGGTGS